MERGSFDIADGGWFDMKFAFILFLTLSVSAHANQKHIVLEKGLCSVIDFAIRNGAEVGRKDLYHCHVITGQTGPETSKSLTVISKKFDGLLCHAHEFDSARQFKAGFDNVNILWPLNGRAHFMGKLETATIIQLEADKFKVSDRTFPKMVNQINFYKLYDSECGKFESFEVMKCKGQSYCYNSSEMHEEYEVREKKQSGKKPVEAVK